VIAYRAMVDVPRELVGYVSRLLRAERRRRRGTRRKARALTPWRQALFALVWFRKREDLTVLAAGFGISRATGYRYRDETVTVLAAQASELTEALQRVRHEGWAFVILDGKIVDTDRVAATTISRKGQVIDLWYSAKKRDFGGNIQAVMRPDGLLIWVSAVPRRRHRGAHSVQAARRRAAPRYGQPHLQHAVTVAALPGRTRHPP
jgi:hypothetical protein